MTGAVILIVAALVQERQDRISAATTQAHNIARLVAGYIQQTVEKNDIILKDVRERIRPADMLAPPGQVSERAEEIHRLLARKLAAVPEGSVLHLSNAAGDHIYSSLEKTPSINIADRVHFIRQREASADAMGISPPLQSRTTGKWAFVTTRRLTFPDGSFAGIANFVIDVDGFETFFASLDIGGKGVITLLNGDGAVMARFPAAPSAMGKPISGSPTIAYVRQGLSHATFAATSPVDGLRRQYGFRAAGDLGLYVVVGLADEDFLSEWWLHAKIFTVVVAMLTAVAGLMISMALRGLVSQEKTLAALASSNAELEQFAYASSHDMREPLRMISSYLGLLERRCGASLDADGREFLGYAKDGAQRLDKMILGLLDYSRIGRTSTPLEAVSLGAVVDGAIANLGVAIDMAHAGFTIAPALPTVLGHRDELVRLLQNLIANAIKYCAPGRPPQVTIAARRDGAVWEISVSDNGIGIAAEHQQRIFRLFQRLHGVDVEGCGIGLANCKKIVENYGGKIWVDSEPGKGSTFHFTLRDGSAAP